MTQAQRPLLLIAALLMLAAPTARAQVQVSTTLFYGSPYVWRGEVLSDGFVLQPTVTASYQGFSLSFFGNLDPNGTASGDKFHFNEADLTAAYGRTFGNVSLSGGYTYYTFPTPAEGKLEMNPTQEIFASAGLSGVPLAPSLFVAYDFDAFDGLYAEAALTQGVTIGEQAFSLRGALGLDHQYVLSDGDTGISHGALTATTGFPVGGLTISPLVGFQVGISDAYRQAYGKTVFYGGLGVTF